MKIDGGSHSTSKHRRNHRLSINPSRNRSLDCLPADTLAKSASKSSKTSIQSKAERKTQSTRNGVFAAFRKQVILNGSVTPPPELSYGLVSPTEDNASNIFHVSLSMDNGSSKSDNQEYDSDASHDDFGDSCEQGGFEVTLQTIEQSPLLIQTTSDSLSNSNGSDSQQNLRSENAAPPLSSTGKGRNWKQPKKPSKKEKKLNGKKKTKKAVDKKNPVISPRKSCSIGRPLSPRMSPRLSVDPQGVYQTTFALRNFPALATFGPEEGLLQREDTLDRDEYPSHRVPLGTAASPLPKALKSINERNTKKKEFLMLESHLPETEIQAIQSELQKFDAEIEALDRDHMMLEDQLFNGQHFSLEHENSALNQDVSQAWSADSLLDISEYANGNGTGLVLPQSSILQLELSKDQRRYLQSKRGLYLTLQIENDVAHGAISQACGFCADKRSPEPYNMLTSITPSRCSDGGAGELVKHVAILAPSENDQRGGSGGFFLCRDDGSSLYKGSLPSRLQRRLKREGKNKMDDIAYLATGPGGSYYAELETGECWWGITGYPEDDDFHRVMNDFDIHRVTFGAVMSGVGDDGEPFSLPSWVVIGRDGQVAWKNVPMQLHQRLLQGQQHAAAPAPAEVSLGTVGSYFIRFLDGSGDYCLPAIVADTCESIEKGGGTITNIAMHGDSRDFIIRHTEVSI
eukprot:CAMPEP_0198301738 /NCGR_PEP_ID=MMETSP1449-20131203/52752_1 /TAXON_ID=420275 /ORGANISM="Attheya septentrionalis, Strain CCMP2084" /LENGTH=685 /DNA_ID=CAMNT_0044003889 /DNA_START=167 /DNA_END=2227 /DNA_ORIENTATION=-